MRTYIDSLNQREVATSIAQMRASADGRSLITYAQNDDRFALYLLLLDRVLDFIGAGVTDHHHAVWRDFYTKEYSPNDAAFEVYDRQVLRWV